MGAAGACLHLLVLVHEAKYGTDSTRWDHDDPQGPLFGYALITAAWIMMTGLVVRTLATIVLALAAGIGIPVPLAYAAWSAVIVRSER